MEFTILKGQKTAENIHGERFEIVGIEININMNNGGGKRFYNRKSSFYKAACASGTKSQGYIIETGKVMLV